MDTNNICSEKERMNLPGESTERSVKILNRAGKSCFVNRLYSLQSIIMKEVN